MEDKDNNKRSEQLLTEALDETMEKEVSNIPDDIEIQVEHTFPKQFDHKINGLVKSKKIHSFNRIMRPIAAALIIIIGIGILATVVLFDNSKSNSELSEAEVADDMVGAASSGYSGEFGGIAEEEHQTASAAGGSNESKSDNTSETDSITSETLDTDQKLIKNVYLNIETKDFNEFYKNLLTNIEKVGGYVENSSIQGSSSEETGNRYGDFVIRIPVEQLEEFLNTTSDLGNITSRQESIKDVTLEYVDTKSRKVTLETAQERLLTLMEQAESVEDIIAIETRLSEVRYELEYYASMLKVYDNQITYSTVTISANEVERITETYNKSVWQTTISKLTDNLYKIKEGLMDIFVWLVSSIPYFVIIGVFVVIIILIVKKKKHGGKKNRR